jgi:hypothetical protein
VSHYLLNYNKLNKEKPWIITETNKEKTKVIGSWFASDFEINTQVKTFVAQYHYLYCEGVVSWNGTKAIINAE